MSEPLKPGQSDQTELHEITINLTKNYPYIQFRGKTDGFVYASLAFYGLDETEFPPLEIGRVQAVLCRDSDLYKLWRDFARKAFEVIVRNTGMGERTGDWEEMPPPQGNA